MKAKRLVGWLTMLGLVFSLAACAVPGTPITTETTPTEKAVPPGDEMTEMLLMMATVAIAQGAPMLGIYGLEANLETGDLTLTPPGKTLSTQLGEATMTITPTLTVNLIRRRGEGVADMAFVLPNLGLYRQISYFVFTPAEGFSGSQTQILRFHILGATLSANWVSDKDGLDGTAQLTFQPIGTVTLEKWTVRADPTTQQPITEMVIVGEFHLPDLRVGSAVVLEEVHGDLRVGLLTGQAPTYHIAWSGKVAITDLPGDTDVAVNTFRLAVDNGKVDVEVRDVALTMAGQPLFRSVQSPD